jgi:hypothetical protein
MPPRLTSSLWTTPDRTRHFILPDDANLPPGDLSLRTASGRQRSVQEAAVVPYEVSKEAARAWADAQLTQVSQQLLGKGLGFVESLQKHTAELREQNRAAWEKGIADAPPEVRGAAQKLYARIQRAADKLRRSVNRQ